MATTSMAPPAGRVAPQTLLAGAILPTRLRLALPTSIAMVATALVASPGPPAWSRPRASR